MNIRKGNSVISSAYRFPGFEDFEWDSELNSPDSVYLSVFIKTTGMLVASASIQKYIGPEIELGYDVADGYRNKGIATEVVKALLEEVHRRFPKTRVVVRTENDNAASRRVAEKCGGVLTESEDTFMTVAASLVKEMDDKGTLRQEENAIYDLVKNYEEQRKSFFFAWLKVTILGLIVVIGLTAFFCITNQLWQ